MVGVPSVFIRTSGCNLRCSWCDTPYTSWQPEGEEMGLAEILSQALSYKGRHAVFTGGEPLLAPQAKLLTEALRNNGFHITIETAGTVDADVACDLMSISPKLTNSTPVGSFQAQHERLRINLPVLKSLMRFPYQLKFVVATPQDMCEVEQLVKQLEAPPANVILMPEGTEAHVLHERSLWLVELAKQFGYRISPRLHVDLYGHRRGV